MTLVKPLVTARLTLRKFMVNDYDDLMAYQSRPDVARYLYRPPWDQLTGRASLERRMTNPFPVSGDGMAFAVVLTETGGVIGEVSLTHTSEAARQAEVGWVFHPDSAGKGYATEAAQAVLKAAFADLDVHRVFARLDEDNLASARLCERLGMRREATLVESDLRVSEFEPNGVWGTELIYALLQKEWEGLRNQGTKR